MASRTSLGGPDASNTDEPGSHDMDEQEDGWSDAVTARGSKKTCSSNDPFGEIDGFGDTRDDGDDDDNDDDWGDVVDIRDADDADTVANGQTVSLSHSERRLHKQRKLDWEAQKKKEAEEREEALLKATQDTRDTEMEKLRIIWGGWAPVDGEWRFIHSDDRALEERVALSLGAEILKPLAGSSCRATRYKAEDVRDAIFCEKIVQFSEKERKEEEDDGEREGESKKAWTYYMQYIGAIRRILRTGTAEHKQAVNDEIEHVQTVLNKAIEGDWEFSYHPLDVLQCLAARGQFRGFSDVNAVMCRHIPRSRNKLRVHSQSPLQIAIAANHVGFVEAVLNVDIPDQAASNGGTQFFLYHAYEVKDVLRQAAATGHVALFEAVYRHCVYKRGDAHKKFAQDVAQLYVIPLAENVRPIVNWLGKLTHPIIGEIVTMYIFAFAVPLREARKTFYSSPSSFHSV